MGRISAPIPITNNHDTSAFSCGYPVLDEWLQRTAIKNEKSGASRTFVVCDGRRVLGYYSLATGAVQRTDAPGKVRRNMPEPVPVLVLGRLAVDVSQQKMGIGRGMLRDALLRAISVAGQVGVKALLVHALDDKAKSFYLSQGFVESPTNDMTLMITIKEAISHSIGS